MPHSTRWCLFFARARTTSRSCRASCRASPGGRRQLRHVASRQSRSRTDCGQRYRLAYRFGAYSCEGLTASAPKRCFRLKPTSSRGDSAGHESRPTGYQVASSHQCRRCAARQALDPPGVALCRQSARRPRDRRTSKAVVKAAAGLRLLDAYIGSADAHAVVTAFVLAATRAWVSAGSIGRTDSSAMGSVRACGARSRDATLAWVVSRFHLRTGTRRATPRLALSWSGRSDGLARMAGLIPCMAEERQGGSVASVVARGTEGLTSTAIAVAWLMSPFRGHCCSSWRSGALAERRSRRSGAAAAGVCRADAALSGCRRPPMRVARSSSPARAAGLATKGESGRRATVHWTRSTRQALS
jgi:hypothetical protein